MNGPQKGQRRISRRRWLAGAAGAAGASAPAVLAVGCGPSASGSIGPALAAANGLADDPLPAGRVEAILPAARMNRAFFRAVRDLEIDDLVEPAVTFVARPDAGSEA